MPQKAKVVLLFVGDIVTFYFALCLSLAIRYGLVAWYGEFTNNHLVPFSAVLIVWIALFYIAGLYDLPRLRNNIDFIKTLSLALGINALITAVLFYLIPYLGIAPKTNLLLFTAIFAFLEIAWRRTWNIRASFREGLNRVLMLDNSPHAHEVVDELTQNPQIGYAINVWHKEGIETAPIERIRTMVQNHDINLVVVPREAKDSKDISKLFYELLSSGVEITDLPTFYESVFRKIPLSEINEGWFIEHRIGRPQFYDNVKRAIEALLSLALIVVLSPVFLIIFVLVKITSYGPAIYAQTRAGKNGAPFTLYKFRSMRALAKDGSAETSGAVWAGANDPRTTPIGRILRHSHLDELPQLANILMGDLSFVGPRPERPEIVAELIKKIPYYEIRLLAKPGITGWAQINYGKDQTNEDVKEKLRHDMYYLKNKSIVLDIAIILKTMKLFFINNT